MHLPKEMHRKMFTVALFVPAEKEKKKQEKQLGSPSIEE